MRQRNSWPSSTGDAFVGAGFDRRFQHRIVASLVLRIDERSHCANRKPTELVSPSAPPYFENAARMSAAGAIAVVGQRFDDERGAAGAVTFVAHFFDVLGIAARRLFDRALDIVLRHVFFARGHDRRAQPCVERRVRQALLGRHRDFAGELGEELGALLILAPLAEHDVLELGMTGHGVLSRENAGQIAGRAGPRQARLKSEAILAAQPLQHEGRKRFGIARAIALWRHFGIQNEHCDPVHKRPRRQHRHGNGRWIAL